VNCWRRGALLPVFLSTSLAKEKGGRPFGREIKGWTPEGRKSAIGTLEKRKKSRKNATRLDLRESLA